MHSLHFTRIKIWKIEQNGLWNRWIYGKLDIYMAELMMARSHSKVTGSDQIDINSLNLPVYYICTIWDPLPRAKNHNIHAHRMYIANGFPTPANGFREQFVFTGGPDIYVSKLLNVWYVWHSRDQALPVATSLCRNCRYSAVTTNIYYWYKLLVPIRKDFGSTTWLSDLFSRDSLLYFFLEIYPLISYRKQKNQQIRPH